jgi:hypothetical protein
METIKVNNNLNFFLIRYFFSIILCFLTLFLTGRIADMDFLLGYIQHGAGGTSTLLASNIYSNLSFIGNKYIIILTLNAICSFILFKLLNPFIDKNNKFIWSLLLMCPGLLIYANSPTKEALFLYPTILFIILECNFLIKKNIKNKLSLNIPLQILLLLFMFLIRGDLAIPYVFLFFICFFLKNFQIRNISSRFKVNQLILFSFLISAIIIFIISTISSNLLQRLLNYLIFSFENYKDIYRPRIDIEFVRNPLNFFQIQYLALFPTPLELFSKPHKLVIILDSVFLIYSYIFSWKRLFRSINKYKSTKTIITILFTYITIIYFSIYGIIGSYNLGSSQRLRLNYIPIGIIFPLLLESKIRLYEDNKLYQS